MRSCSSTTSVTCLNVANFSFVFLTQSIMTIDAFLRNIAISTQLNRRSFFASVDGVVGGTPYSCFFTFNLSFFFFTILVLCIVECSNTPQRKGDEMQLQRATAVCVYDIIRASVTGLVLCASCLCALCFFVPRNQEVKEYSCERPDGVGKAPLLDAAARNGADSSTFSVSTWWL